MICQFIFCQITDETSGYRETPVAKNCSSAIDRFLVSLSREKRSIVQCTRTIYESIASTLISPLRIRVCRPTDSLTEQD